MTTRDTCWGPTSRGPCDHSPRGAHGQKLPRARRVLVGNTARAQLRARLAVTHSTHNALNHVPEHFRDAEGLLVLYKDDHPGKYSQGARGVRGILLFPEDKRTVSQVSGCVVCRITCFRGNPIPSPSSGDSNKSEKLKDSQKYRPRTYLMVVGWWYMCVLI